MKRFILASAALVSGGLLSLGALDPAQASSVTARISIAQQRMEVLVDGKIAHTWAVSTGREDFDTPTGNYTPTWLDKDHRSQKYDDAPMPYAVFFRGGFAVHGTTATGMLGRRASHGCVRLATGNARQFYELVQAHGLSSARIIIQDNRLPGNAAPVVASTEPRRTRTTSQASLRGTERGAGRHLVTSEPHYQRTSYGAPLYYQVGPNGQLIPQLMPMGQPIYRSY